MALCIYYQFMCIVYFWVPRLRILCDITIAMLYYPLFI